MSDRSNARRWAAGPALLLAVSVGFGSAPAAPTTQPAGEAGRYQRLVDDLAADAMEGRAPGTHGLELAREYVVREFRSTGLRPAFGDGYTQPFQVRLGVQVAAQELGLTGPDGKPVAAAKAGEDFSALGFSASKGFGGPAVFVGYAVANPQRKYDSFAGLAKDGLRGKVAVAFRYEPQDETGRSRWADGSAGSWTRSAALTSKARWAAQRGAAALLLVNPPSQDRDKALRSAEETAIGGRQSIPVMHISSGLFAKMLAAANLEGPASSGPPGAMKPIPPASGPAAPRPRQSVALQAQADRGEAKPFELAGLTVRGKVRLESRRGEIHNVAALLPGADKLDVRMGGGGVGPSDHASFHARKIPVLFFITGGHSDVHRPGDTADKINAAGAVEVLRLIRAVVEELRTDPNAVAYVAPKAATTQPAGRTTGGAFLGVMPDPAAVDIEAGCPLMEVIDGGPAARAGLEAGDIITGWNGKPVETIDALLEVLRRHKPGDAVKVTVQRGARKLTLDVTLGSR